jgi:hypothetical protein
MTGAVREAGNLRFTTLTLRRCAANGIPMKKAPQASEYVYKD